MGTQEGKGKGGNYGGDEVRWRFAIISTDGRRETEAGLEDRGDDEVTGLIR